MNIGAVSNGTPEPFDVVLCHTFGVGERFGHEFWYCDLISVKQELVVCVCSEWCVEQLSENEVPSYGYVWVKHEFPHGVIRCGARSMLI